MFLYILNLFFSSLVPKACFFFPQSHYFHNRELYKFTGTTTHPNSCEARSGFAWQGAGQERPGEAMWAVGFVDGKGGRSGARVHGGSSLGESA